MTTSTAHIRVGPRVNIENADPVSEQPNPDGSAAVAHFHVWFSQALDHQVSVDFQPYTLLASTLAWQLLRQGHLASDCHLLRARR